MYHHQDTTLTLNITTLNDKMAEKCFIPLSIGHSPHSAAGHTVGQILIQYLCLEGFCKI